MKIVFYQVFLRRFRDPIRLPRFSNRVPRIRKLSSVPKIRKSGPYKSIPGT